MLVVELAQAVVDAGAVPLLVLCIQEPELSLKRISASALSDICKHSTEVRVLHCRFVVFFSAQKGPKFHDFHKRHNFYYMYK